MSKTTTAAAAAGTTAAPTTRGRRFRTAAAAHGDRVEQLDRVVVPAGAAGGIVRVGHRAADLERRAALTAAEVVARHETSLRPDARPTHK